MLLKPRRMNQEPSRWRRLTPAVVAALPEAAAVFEVANLVRTVKYIGSAGGNLRARLSALQTQMKLKPSPGGYFFRYETATREDDVLARRLAAYRTAHRGLLPVANTGTPLPLRVASRRAA
jgi:hypothetical protein